jgi:hypothetical protein
MQRNGSPKIRRNLDRHIHKCAPESGLPGRAQPFEHRSGNRRTDGRFVLARRRAEPTVRSNTSLPASAPAEVRRKGITDSLRIGRQDDTAGYPNGWSNGEDPVAVHWRSPGNRNWSASFVCWGRFTPIWMCSAYLVCNLRIVGSRQRA